MVLPTSGTVTLALTFLETLPLLTCPHLQNLSFCPESGLLFIVLDKVCSSRFKLSVTLRTHCRGSAGGRGKKQKLHCPSCGASLCNTDSSQDWQHSSQTWRLKRAHCYRESQPTRVLSMAKDGLLRYPRYGPLTTQPVNIDTGPSSSLGWAVPSWWPFCSHLR